MRAKILIAVFIIFILFTVSADERVDRIDAALKRAAEYLLSKQSPDGAWRSETYGCFGDDPALTPYVMSSLFFMPQAGMPALKAYDKGVTYLVGLVDKDGKIKTRPYGLNFPVYTAASASRVVVLSQRTPKHKRIQAIYLAYVRSRHLNRDLGWTPDDPEFGGWGFSLEPPRKPEPGKLKGAFVESNLSATIFGIAALQSSRIPKTDPVWQDILVFVKRCQNYTDDPEAIDKCFDDGGFHFIPNDSLQNKAGIAGTDSTGRERFNSYGTMTADGVRALLQCGLKPDHPRVTAARKWLEHNFRADTNPGIFTPDREVLRDATYYYWAWSVSHAFMALRVDQIETADGKVRIEKGLAHNIKERQNHHLDIVTIQFQVLNNRVCICNDVSMGKHHSFCRAG